MIEFKVKSDHVCRHVHVMRRAGYRCTAVGPSALQYGSQGADAYCSAVQYVLWALSNAERASGQCGTSELEV